MNFDEELKLRTEDTEEVVLRYLPEEKGLQKNLIAAANYSVLAGGKRLRPLIMREVYRFFDGHERSIEPFMAAIEYIHTASLIHDDLPCIDNDEYRRGKKSAWAEFGEDMALLAGDMLIFYAFETAGKAFSLSTNPKNVGNAMMLLAEKSGFYGMVAGETLDVEKTGQSLSEEELDFIYEKKTGALLEAAMVCGAILADASKEDIAAVSEIAKKIGYAFQIEDDILDITSTTEKLGKPARSDERNGKTTYVSLHGMEESKEEVRVLTEEALGILHRLPGENAFLETLLRSLTGRER